MRMWRLGSLLWPAAVLLLAAAPPVTLVPAAKWTVDVADHYCVLGRAYDGAVGRVALDVRPEYGFDDAQVTIGSAALARTMRRGEVAMVLGDATFPAQVERVADDRTVLSPVGEGFLAAFARAAALTVTVDGSPAVALPIPSAAAGLRATKQCHDTTLTKFGIPPGDVVPLPERIDPRRLVGSDDYPSDALIDQAGGRVVVALGVGRDGRGQQCRVLVPSGRASLDKMGCIPALRLRLDPAASGPAIRWVVFKLRWQARA